MRLISSGWFQIGFKAKLLNEGVATCKSSLSKIAKLKRALNFSDTKVVNLLPYGSILYLTVAIAVYTSRHT